MLVGFRAKNHPQQTGKNGAVDSVDDRATDPVLFALLSERFGGFTLDVAAAEHNTKCEKFYDLRHNGLMLNWFGRVWCNPPYSAIEPWVRKAWIEAPHCETIVMLLPNNRCEQKWWQRLVEPKRDRPESPLRTEFLPGRPRFIRGGADEIRANERPPFGAVLLIWRIAP